MSGHELARELLTTATSDLKALANMTDSHAFDERVFGFHAQQAVEKALKAWLNAASGSHPFTHDLSLLVHALEDLGEDVGACWGFLDLTAYAVRFRYEVLPKGEEPLDRDAVVKDVDALIDSVRRKLLVG